MPAKSLFPGPKLACEGGELSPAVVHRPGPLKGLFLYLPSSVFRKGSVQVISDGDSLWGPDKLNACSEKWPILSTCWKQGNSVSLLTYRPVDFGQDVLHFRHSTVSFAKLEWYLNSLQDIPFVTIQGMILQEAWLWLWLLCGNDCRCFCSLRSPNLYLPKSGCLNCTLCSSRECGLHRLWAGWWPPRPQLGNVTIMPWKCSISSCLLVDRFML